MDMGVRDLLKINSAIKTLGNYKLMISTLCFTDFVLFSQVIVLDTED